MTNASILAAFERFWQHVVVALSNKIDKVDGKGLSSNDYTTDEKDKLNGIEDGANKTHIVDNLTEENSGKALDAKQGKQLDDKITGVKDNIREIFDLIGDSSVADQINSSVLETRQKYTSINLPASNWTGDVSPWHQAVSISGITENSKIDLHATALQIIALQESNISFIAENDNGVVTVYAIGDKPTVDYDIQADITEVVVV